MIGFSIGRDTSGTWHADIDIPEADMPNMPMSEEVKGFLQLVIMYVEANRPELATLLAPLKDVLKTSENN